MGKRKRSGCRNRFARFSRSTSIGLIVNKENEQNVTTQVISGILDKFVQQTNLTAAGATPTYELQFQSISAGKLH